MKGFEELEHTADWAFRAYGSDLAELFTNAARGMFELQARNPPPAAPAQEREVEVQGFDRETLLVNWLNELLYLQEKEGFTANDFIVREVSENRLRARIRGQLIPGSTRLIKAVTFHGLEIKQTAQGWEATVVVDV